MAEFPLYALSAQQGKYNETFFKNFFVGRKAMEIDEKIFDFGKRTDFYR